MAQKKLTLKNYFFIGNMEIGVNPLQVWLNNLMLHGKDSRERSRFLNIIKDRTEEVQKEREKMVEAHATKNKKGEIIYIDQDKKETTDKSKGISVKIDKEASLAFNKEFTEYTEEELVIDVSPANSATIYAVRDIILNTKQEFSGMSARMYEEWCNAFESIA